jgi:hypothetical protein
MAPEPSPSLATSGLTMSSSDSETYEREQHSPAPSTTSSPLILYKPPTLWGLLRGAAINLVLPFVNGLMLGFGELVANEMAFRLGWSGTKVRRRRRRRKYGGMGRKGIRIRIDANTSCVYRFSQTDARIRDPWDRAWKCVLILWSGGGGVGGKWTCIRPWSEWAARTEGRIQASVQENKALCDMRNHTYKESVFSDQIYLCIIHSTSLYMHTCVSANMRNQPPSYRIIIHDAASANPQLLCTLLILKPLLLLELILSNSLLSPHPLLLPRNDPRIPLIRRQFIPNCALEPFPLHAHTTLGHS